MSGNLYSCSEYKLEPKFSYLMEGATFKRICMYARMPSKMLQLGRVYCRIKSNGVLYVVVCIVSANPKLLIYLSPFPKLPYIKWRDRNLHLVPCNNL